MIKATTFVHEKTALLEHWARHYLGLGAECLLIHVFGRELMEEARVLCDQRGWHAEIIPVPSAALALMAVPETLDSHDWIILAEIDELIQFPLALKSLVAEIEANGATSLLGTCADRLAQNGYLTTPTSQPSLWEQYPLEAPVLQRLCKLKISPRKVVLCRGMAGQDESVDGVLVNNAKVVIHSFRWREGVVSRLASQTIAYPGLEPRTLDGVISYLKRRGRLIPESFGAICGWNPEFQAELQQAPLTDSVQPYRGSFRYFGINYANHDGGIAGFDQEGRLLVFSQTERISRKKGDGEVEALDQAFKCLGMRTVDRDDLIFTSWPRRYKLYYRRKPLEVGRGASHLPGYMEESRACFIGHHLCHIAAAWMFRPMETPEECLYIALDGMGYRSDGQPGCYSMGVISPTRFVEFSFLADEQRYSPYRRLNPVRLPDTTSLSVAGKLMGLAGYITGISKGDSHPVEWLNRRIETQGLTPEVMRFLATLYLRYIEDVKRLIQSILKAYPQYKTVVVGGGAFLALELNSWIVEQGRNLIFAPPTNDSGIALGNAAYGYFLIHGRWPQRLDSPFLQWGPAEQRQLYLPPRQAAAVLAAGEIIGVVIGQGESGPRALGHRSLLALPTTAQAQKVSMTIKGREFYRPVAPIVTDRMFDRFFRGARGVYMQFRNQCTDEARTLTPGIVHRDQSARVQVLTPPMNAWLYEVLVEVGRLTGAECLINTSLNGKGMPICNTLCDAQKELAGFGIHFVGF